MYLTCCSRRLISLLKQLVNIFSPTCGLTRSDRSGLAKYGWRQKARSNFKERRVAARSYWTKVQYDPRLRFVSMTWRDYSLPKAQIFTGFRVAFSHPMSGLAGGRLYPDRVSQSRRARAALPGVQKARGQNVPAAGAISRARKQGQ